ncbi:MAG: ribose-phosphate diphosphokinase [Alphaproteobacteria bacterium]|nr:ribose-phosphate diphosphokinase [Alphaproteobacteria bacterium]
MTKKELYGDADKVKQKLADGGEAFCLSLGRRAPMHCMHVDCVLEIERAGLTPILVIGSTNGPESHLYDPVHNPLTVEQQKEQFRHAIGDVDYNEAHILEIPDYADDNKWMRELVQKTKDIGVHGKAVVHLRSKAADAKNMSNAIKPLSQYTQAFINSGFSVWQSYNADPKNDDINASAMRKFDLNNLTVEQRHQIAAPAYIISIARKAREDNPDKDILAQNNVPLTVLDLALDRLYREAGVRTKDIIAIAKDDNDMSLDGIANAATKLAEKVRGKIQKPANENTTQKPLLFLGNSVSAETAATLKKDSRFDSVGGSIGKFQSGEHYAELFYGDTAHQKENADRIKGAKAVVVQSTAEPVGDNVSYLLGMIHTLKWHGAKDVTAVIPFAAYARQDRAFDNRLTSVEVDLFAKQLKAAGADKVVTFTMHSQAGVNIFKGTFGDNFTSVPVTEIFSAHLKGKFPFTSSEIISGAPDGAEKPHDEGQARARALATSLTGQFNDKAIFRISKKHVATSETKITSFNGDVAGKDCVIIDDMVDGGSTLVNAAKILKQNGAKSVTCCVTHGILTPGTGTALERLMTAKEGTAPAIDNLVMTDSIPEIAGKIEVFARQYPELAEKIDVISLGPAIQKTLDSQATPAPAAVAKAKQAL